MSAVRGLGGAVDEVAAAALKLRRAAPDGEAQAQAIAKIRLGAEELAQFDGVPLSPVYREFLRAHSSHDFVDAGLRHGARSVWISAATSVLELTALYAADTPSWRPSWLVFGLAEDGCYVLDLHGRAGDDCMVHHVADSGASVPIGQTFTDFLRQVARDSAPAVPEDRAVRRQAAAAVAERDDRVEYVLPLVMAMAAAALLWWLY